MNSQTKFKQTEIGEIPEDWDLIVLDSFCNINPFRKLTKRVIAKRISMSNIKEFTRKIQYYEDNEYNGGSKFKNKDTIMARITPCLENGKTAYVNILNDEEIAFGSTEFIVISEKENISDSKYIYYLIISPNIRSKAIKSMVGTSGRQRVQNDIFSNILISHPKLKEQKAIAKILSDLDSKIELLQQQNKTLEDIGKTIFKQWFIDFEFPNDEGNPYKSSGGEMVESEFGGIPKEWNFGSLGQIISKINDSTKAGKHLSNRKYVPIDQLPMKNLAFNSYHSYEGAKSSLITFEKNDILLGAMRVYFHRVNISPFAGVTRTTIFVLRPKNNNLLSYSLFVLYQDSTIEYANTQSKGTTMPYAVWKNSLEDMGIIIPSETILNKFSIIMKPIIHKIRDSIFELETLQKSRDLLLPKLMSGKIRVGQ